MRVVEYDPRWPVLFAAERAALEAALGALLCGPVEHIGSTAIPGIVAKPVVDMLAPVARLADARLALDPLAALGYGTRAHCADALLFVKPGSEDPENDTHHLHLTEPGSQLWRERLLFRDAVRSDPALRAEYAELKRALLAASGGAGYPAEGKRAFVRRVLDGAGHQLRDGLHADGRGS